MSETYKPKFKVGDRVIDKTDPNKFRIITDVIHRYEYDHEYDYDLYENCILMGQHMAYSSWMEENNTLDLNHYIKNL